MIMKLFAQDKVSPSPLPPLAQVGENKGFRKKLKASEFHRETLQSNDDPLCSIGCTIHDHAQYCLKAIEVKMIFRSDELAVRVAQMRCHARHDAVAFQNLAKEERPRVASQTVRPAFDPLRPVETQNE
jgi:hypothetical protein